jgi:hypothetical protein
MIIAKGAINLQTCTARYMEAAERNWLHSIEHGERFVGEIALGEGTEERCFRWNE